MNINIFRRRFTPWSVDGTMLIGGKIFCDTLERPGHCLPAGRYKISLIPVRQMKEVEKKKKKNYERGKYEIVIKPANTQKTTKSKFSTRSHYTKAIFKTKDKRDVKKQNITLILLLITK